MVGVARRRLSRLIVSTVSLRNIRSYARLDLTLESGLVLVVGPNAAGKTNLLESLHVATQGLSPRTRADAQLVRFGEGSGPVAVQGRPAASDIQLESAVAVRDGHRPKG